MTVNQINSTTNNDDVVSLFVSKFPFDERENMTSIIIEFRKRFSDSIPAVDKFVLPFISTLNRLKATIHNLPLSLRKIIKVSAIDVLEKVLDISPEVFALFTIILCSIELSAIRNTDRADMESEDIAFTINLVNNKILFRLSQKVLNLRVNFPSLLPWSYGMLMYTYRSCQAWVCNKIVIGESFCVLLPLDEKLFKCLSIPALLRHVLECQHNFSPYPVPLNNHTLTDALFITSVCSKSLTSTAHVYNEKESLNTGCFLEMSEPSFMLSNNYSLCKPSANLLFMNKLEKNDIISVEAVLMKSVSSSDILATLLFLENILLSNSSALSKKYHDTINLALRRSPFIIANFLKPLHVTQAISKQDVMTSYENVYCALLRLWISAILKRSLNSLLDHQVWMVGFTTPHFSNMNLAGFVEAATLQTKFLISYSTVYRKNILVSPHWFLQMLSDIVIAIMDRFEEEYADGITEHYILEDCMSNILAGVSRTWLALRADEPEVRPELSRAVKPLLDSIIVRLAEVGSNSRLQRLSANAKAITKTDTSVKSNKSRITALSSRFRAQLNSSLLFQILTCIDPWALGQSRIGLKPLGARELLRQIIQSCLAKDEAFCEKMEVESSMVRRHQVIHQHKRGDQGYKYQNILEKRTVETETMRQNKGLSVIIPMVQPAITGTGRVAGIKRKFSQIH